MYNTSLSQKHCVHLPREHNYMQTTAVPTLSWSLHVLLPVEEHVSTLFALVHLLHLFGHDGGHVGVVELKPALSLGRRGPGGGGTGR